MRFSIIKQFYQGFSAVWLPSGCWQCGQGTQRLCSSCLAHRPTFVERTCKTCDGALAKKDRYICAFCQTKTLSWVCSASPYKGLWKTWLLQAKFKSDQALFKTMANVLATELATETLAEKTAIIPIPASNRQSILRGPVLTLTLAQTISAQYGWPVFPLLYRQTPSRSQRQQTRADRQQLQPADYTIVGQLPREIEQILLVDDVMTTGATLLAAASALRLRYPDMDVAAAVLARA